MYLYQLNFVRLADRLYLGMGVSDRTRDTVIHDQPYIIVVLNSTIYPLLPVLSVESSRLACSVRPGPKPCQCSVTYPRTQVLYIQLASNGL